MAQKFHQYEASKTILSTYSEKMAGKRILGSETRLIQMNQFKDDDSKDNCAQTSKRNATDYQVTFRRSSQNPYPALTYRMMHGFQEDSPPNARETNYPHNSQKEKRIRSAKHIFS